VTEILKGWKTAMKLVQNRLFEVDKNIPGYVKVVDIKKMGFEVKIGSCFIWKLFQGFPIIC